MFADMVTLNVGDPVTVKYGLYGFAIIVSIFAVLALRKVIWIIFPRVKATVTKFEFIRQVYGNGAVYCVGVEYDKKGMKCTKEVEYTEIIVSDGRPKYLPGDIIILRENPITGSCRTDEVVRLENSGVTGTIMISFLAISLWVAAIKFHLFANEFLKDSNEAEIPQSAMETVIFAFVGIMFIAPIAMSILDAVFSMIKGNKLRMDYEKGKYTPLTTVLAGYTLVRRKTKRNGHKTTRYYYYPYYKYQLGSEIQTVVSDISSYDVDISQVGKNYSCFRHIDTDKTIGYNPEDISTMGELMTIIALGGFLAVFIFIISQVTF